MRLREKIRAAGRRVRRDAHVLWLAARDKRTPLAAKLIGAAVAAYVLSPIDLIPDFIPVFGLLDELLLVPLAMLAARRLIPAPLLAHFNAEADAALTRPQSHAGAIVIVCIWLLLLGLLAMQLLGLRYW